jgi:CRP/FNR family cyclic AMP-dependent transcriptional regulator
MNTSGKYLMLKQLPILSALNEDEFNQIANASTYMQYKKGDIIYNYGDVTKGVYILDKGSVKLANTASCGKTLIKDIVYDGDIFGENVFTNEVERKNYAEAATVAKLFIIPIEVFKGLVTSNPAFARMIMDTIIQRIQLLDQRMQNFVFKKAKSRIVDFIMATGKARGIKIGMDECLINHGMSHKEIAYLTDTSRQTVARVLGELKKDNVIHFSTRKPGKILIRNFSY